jgi:hypothetical protein
MSPLLMRVSRSQASWRVQYGEVMLEYSTRAEAVSAAIDRAKRLSKDGQVVAVVMDVITSVYGTGGFIRTIPTRRRPVPMAQLPVDAFEELISLEPDSSPTPPA